MLDSLYKSMTGLIGFSKALDNLSNNVSNLNTPGYKGNDVIFRELGSDSFSASGDNKDGFNSSLDNGVKVSGTSIRFTQGDVKETGVDTDIAIEGSAFFVLNGAGGEYYTRNGQFRFDEDGFLVEPETGYKVMMLSESGKPGFLNINDFTLSSPIASSDITFTGTLSSTASLGAFYPDSEDTTLTGKLYDPNGREHEFQYRFEKVGERTWEMAVLNSSGIRISPVHTLEFTQLGSLITEYSEYSFNFQDFEILEEDKLHESFLPGEMVEYSNGLSDETVLPFSFDDSYLILKGENEYRLSNSSNFAFNSSGELIEKDSGLPVFSRDSSGTLTEFSIADKLEFPFTSTSSIALTGNLNSSIPASGTIPPASEDPVRVDYVNYEGEQDFISVRFENQGNNTWVLLGEDSNGDALQGAGNILFDQNGNLDVVNSSLTIAFSNPDQGQITVSLADESGDPLFTSSAQDGAVIQLEDDGALSSSIVSLQFNQDGEITVTYGNGNQETGPQLAIVRKVGEAIEDLKFDLSGLSSPSVGASSVNIEESDGRGLGRISSYGFDEFGKLKINYTNGEVVSTDPIALANIVDHTKLYAAGDTLFRLEKDGERILGNVEKDSFAKLVPHSLELSNVELSREFADIIVVQRGYQASSQVLSVTNEMIEELYNTIRGR